LEALRHPQLSRTIRQDLEQASTYFRSHKHQMHYAGIERRGSHWLRDHGSGLQDPGEATSVLLGMKWAERGARLVLSLRALVLTDQRAMATILGQDQSIRIRSSSIDIAHQYSVTPVPERL
jgi:hypothetical protein